MAGKGDKPDLEQLLSSYIDGTCSDQERQQVEQALQRDPRLRALYKELRRTVDAIRAVPSEAAPGYVRERILSQLERRALLGIGSAGAGEPARGARRPRSTGWLGLLAAAMLVAGVGATWWVRMQQEKVPQQLAMAPTPSAQDQRVVARDVIPQTESGRTRGEGQGHRGQDAVRREPLATPGLDRALAMGEQRGGAVSAGKPQGVQSFGGRMAETTPAPVAPQTNSQAAQSGPGGEADASRLTGAIARSKEAPSADALAAVPLNKGMADPAAKDTVDLAAEAAPAVAPAAEVPVSTMAQAAPARSAGLHSLGGRSKGAAEPTVMQLQVGVQDAGQQSALASVIRSRVVDRGGQFAVRADQSVIPVADPTGWGLELAAEIEQVPGVVYVRPDVLPASDPLARQASSLAAEQQFGQMARVAQDCVAGAAPGQGPAATVTRLRFSPDFHVAFYDVPPIVRRQYVPLVTPLVIVLQPVAPEAASQPAGQ